MNNSLKNKNFQNNYINSSSEFALLDFKEHLYNILYKYKNCYTKYVALCIGSDRATGDSLGPLVGYKLSKLPFKDTVAIYGTLDKPVHAKNLKETINEIYMKYERPFIIAIDASLGAKEYISYINIGEGSIRPGAGINKKLPPVGDIFITGIVNHSGILEISVLQNIRLSLVMNMADIISSGLWHCINKI